jgi:mannose-6-phosphate isomerase-like protein (cupin superfamily)
LKTISEIKIESDFKRPWGGFIKFVENKRCTVKIIRIKAGESLSLQSHKLRNEFWYVTSGKIKVTLGRTISKVSQKILTEDQFVFIHKNFLHRAMALKASEILEISFGKFAEKDIIRYEDKYGRI